MSARQPSFDKRTPAWMRRIALFLENDKTMKLVEWAAILLFLATASGSYFLLNSQSGRTDFISPPLTAALLVVNLIPAITLLVLLGRRIAKGRAAQSVIATSGRLHVRLVVLFSLIASIPMLLVVIFASLLFQYGVEFWFSDRARGMLENANNLARGYYDQNRRDDRRVDVGRVVVEPLGGERPERVVVEPVGAEDEHRRAVRRRVSHYRLHVIQLYQLGGETYSRLATVQSP